MAVVRLNSEFMIISASQKILRKLFVRAYFYFFLHFFAFDFDFLLGQGPWGHKLSKKPIHAQTIFRILGARAKKPFFRDFFKKIQLPQFFEFSNEITCSDRVFDALRNFACFISIRLFVWPLERFFCF